ncbi:hypothetical protein N356_gp097 [Cellulophaga phage phi14:2]|uniref:Uncharacterized protein n=1 Tax=Cellulophaga phage phi14:2 TaxID=1327990 RepID=S0A2F9_9CAUD|nr:hypothetical protein N356_gp097 [Cellulophaga phage phi14:2]AGO48990.1 hypothetical protein Phi14:2_gp112 [Cellulophaga phage phi14:2]
MKLKEIFNLKNVASFIEGNSKYFYNQLIGLDKDKQEQALWRLSKCEEDCMVTGKCVHCGCPPEKKAFTTTSCNKGARFPDLMDAEAWEKYKQDNNIENE